MTPEPSPTEFAFWLPILVGVYAVSLHYARAKSGRGLDRWPWVLSSVLMAMMAVFDLGKLDAGYQPALTGVIALIGFTVKGKSNG